jgi:hypothetical protein
MFQVPLANHPGFVAQKTKLLRFEHGAAAQMKRVGIFFFFETTKRRTMRNLKHRYGRVRLN